MAGTRTVRWLAFAALAVGVLAFLAVDQRTGWPAPDAPSYQQLAESLASGDGYRVDLDGEPAGSRYPPGFAMLLALLSPFGGAPAGAVLLGGALAAAVWAAARRAGGPVAATVAVLMVALYLPRHPFAGAVMADTAGALFVVLALLAVQSGRERLAGVLAGFGVWVRLAHVVLVIALPRRARAPFVALCAGLAATKVAWGWGYRDGQAEWSLVHVWDASATIGDQAATLPNSLAYPLMMLGLTGGIMLPGAVLLAGWALWRRPERRFVLLTVGGLLAVYLPYFYQASRFMFPVAALVAIYSGAAVSDLSRREDAGSGQAGDPATKRADRGVLSGTSSVKYDEFDVLPCR